MPAPVDYYFSENPDLMLLQMNALRKMSFILSMDLDSKWLVDWHLTVKWNMKSAKARAVVKYNRIVVRSHYYLSRRFSYNINCLRKRVPLQKCKKVYDISVNSLWIHGSPLYRPCMRTLSYLGNLRFLSEHYLRDYAFAKTLRRRITFIVVGLLIFFGFNQSRKIYRKMWLEWVFFQNCE